MRKVILLLALSLICTASFAQSQTPFNILIQDKSIVLDTRFEDSNIWIKLAPAHMKDQIVVRISNRNRDFYRPWLHGELDLVSTGFRANEIWSDRVQTEANYVEYWLGDTLVLHLERK